MAFHQECNGARRLLLGWRPTYMFMMLLLMWCVGARMRSALRMSHELHASRP